jgi:hypothetical protein
VIYVEYIERDRWVPIEVFRHLGEQQSNWAEGSADRMVLQLGRTLRLGPRPSYLCLWDIPDIGRLDAWEDYFHSSAALSNARSLAMHRAINIDRAGLYDVLRQESLGEAPLLYIVEYCEPAPVKAQAILESFADRAKHYGDLKLGFLLLRLGHLGPDPALLSIWAAPSYVAAESLLRAAPPDHAKIIDVGIYRSFGGEIL